MTTPPRKPLQFGLASLFWLTSGVAAFAWVAIYRPGILAFAAVLGLAASALCVAVMAMSGLVKAAVVIARNGRKPPE